MGVVNFGTMSTATNVAMVARRRCARTWIRCVAWRHTTRRPNDAAMVDMYITLLTRCAVTVALSPDLRLVYNSL